MAQRPNPSLPASHPQPGTSGAGSNPPESDQPTAMEPMGAAAGSGPAQWRSFAGQSFGDFELLQEVGRGGMGIVYKARQKSLDRLVALKVLLADTFRQPAILSRFLTEAQAAAALAHPNIVTIYQVGECPAGHYYIMEFLEGLSLESVLQERQVPVSWAVSLMIRISEAVHYAHTKGIIHRDLKPANIMIDRFRGPVVMDFGIAKIVGKSTGLTEYGAIMGTPAYMAPEQAREDSHPVGPLSDVYGLGAILYRLLTGRLPFDGNTPLAALVKVVSPEMPVPVRGLRPEVTEELEWICMKCLNKAPEDRYPSAQALARELRRIRGTAPADAGSASASPPEPEVSFSDELLAIERTGQAAEPARPRKRRKSARPKTRKDRPMKPVDDDEGTDFLGLDDEAGTSAAMPPAAELPGELLSDLLDIERTGKTDDSSVEEMADVERLAPGPPAAPVVPDLELPGADEVELEPADEVEPEAAAEEVELEPVAAPGRPPATMRAHLPSVVLTSLANDQKVRLFKATNLLGRSSECDIILQAADVSKRHCQVHVAAGGVTIEDLNSVNGIQVNGRTVKRCRLKDGDRLEIAGHAFQVHVSKPKK